MLWTTLYIVSTAFATVHGSSTRSLPNVTLPWGTYQASLYDPLGDFYTFTNVRFGKAPVGQLRFQKSVFPDSIEDPTKLQLNEGSSCYIATSPAHPKAVRVNSADTAAGSSRLIPSLPKSPEGEPSEDCLFADIYVPASALAGDEVPIVVWFYGGGFIFGSKDAGFGNNMPFYNGTGLLRTAHARNQDFIFVTGNYRLGAFGWLAGPTVEQHGMPNAGLWDQRLLLDFAHQYLPLFGGNASNIGVWGESAGGGSILHHLTSTEPPVFTRALMQSPAYLWQWDRSERGYAARVFHNLTVKAGCPSEGAEALSCLQGLDDVVLQDLNQAIVTQEVINTGLIPFNPAVDGSLIQQLPTTAFEQGAIWKNVTSLIVSHVADESKSFTPAYIRDNSTFQTFLNEFFPGPTYVDERNEIERQYRHIEDPWQRAHNVIADSSFLCNTRSVYDAYYATSTVYMMQYEFFEMLGAAVHASDLLPTFYNTDISERDFYLWFVKNISPKSSPDTVEFFLARIKALAQEYQPYLASFGATGIPMPNEAGSSPDWNVATQGDELSDVMRVSWRGLFSDMKDDTADKQNTKRTCDFWSGIALSVQKAVRRREQQIFTKLEL